MPKITRKHEWKDQYTLLCESCGYIIEDLDHSLPCPECAKPIQESLPHPRKGSPWQYHRSFRTLIQTWFQIIFHSKRFFTQLNANEDDARTLMWRGLLFASLIPVCTATTLILISTIMGEIHAVYLIGIPIILLFPAVIYWAFAMAYAALAAPRIRIIAKHQGHRPTQCSIWSIVGHASMGLTIAPLLVSCNILLHFVMVIYGIEYNSTIGMIFTITTSVLSWIALPLAVAEFEILLSIGSRRLRYRNRQSIESVKDLYKTTQTPQPPPTPQSPNEPRP